jgi:trehalose 6-phosphate phosphatase
VSFRSKEDLTNWVLAAKFLWLFLDYDGTLADFAPTPEIIETNPRIVKLLERMVHVPTFRLTILSGRRLGHIRLLVPIGGIFLAGTYGIELLTPTGETFSRVDYGKMRPALEPIKRAWESIIDGQKGIYLEDKGWTLALHARFADDPTAQQVLTQARRVIDQVAVTSHFRILDGHKFLEIAPRLASKKETVAYLLRQYPLTDTDLLYIGDDDKDEEAFPVIHAQQGVTVKVRQPSQAARPTTADFFFESPNDTLEWLEKLVSLHDA